MNAPKLNTKLDLEIAVQIKKLIWHGTTQEECARQFNLSQTHISRIVRGIAWYSARWPNGEVGPMPAARIAELRSVGPFQPRRPILVPTETSTEQPTLETVEPSRRPTAEEIQQKILDEEQSRAAMRDQIENLGELADESLANELASTVKAVKGKRKPRKDITDEDTMETLEWEDIVSRAPNIKPVLLGQNRPSYRPAICKALTAMSESDWKTERAMRMVEAVAQVMEIKDDGIEAAPDKD